MTNNTHKISSISDLDVIEVLSATAGGFKLPADMRMKYSIVKIRLRGNVNNCVLLCADNTINPFLLSTTKTHCKRMKLFFAGVYLCPPMVIQQVNDGNKVTSIRKTYSDTEKQISSLIDVALNKGDVSDIHIQLIKGEQTTEISFRIKGQLTHYKYISFTKGEQILNALFQKAHGKNGALLNYNNITSIPVVWDGDVNKSIRVEFSPNAMYFKSVWRLFGSIKANGSKYSDLGYDEPTCDFFKRLEYNSIGAVLITGPVGSGKTTTMYTHLSNVIKTHTKAGRCTKNICSIEDPVEKIIPGADQRQIDSGVNDKTKAIEDMVASLLRSDPDIVFMGEIRYQSQADVLLDIGEIGSSAYGTMHADTHVGTVRRLRNKFGFDADYFDARGSLTAIVSQRLIPSICHKCCLSYKEIQIKDPDRLKAAKYYLDNYISDYNNLVFVNNDSRCESCASTGYTGRVLVYEVYNPSPNIDNVARLYKQSKYSEGYQAFMDADNSNGLDGVTLGERCLQKIKQGIICASDGANLINTYPVPDRCLINEVGNAE